MHVIAADDNWVTPMRQRASVARVTPRTASARIEGSGLFASGHARFRFPDSRTRSTTTRDRKVVLDVIHDAESPDDLADVVFQPLVRDGPGQRDAP